MVEVRTTRIGKEDIRAVLKRLEAKYETPTADFIIAFRNEEGELVETDDFHLWCLHEAAWNHLWPGEAP